jgi:hypothetical protein
MAEHVVYCLTCNDLDPMLFQVEKPTFVVKVEDVKVKEGEPAKLVAKATGEPTPTLTWYREDSPIQSDDIYKVIPGEEGESTLLLPEAFPEDAGVYTVKAVNEAGEVTTTAVLTVIGRFPWQPCRIC